MGIRLGLEIHMEIIGEGSEGFFLAGQQAAIWILDRRPGSSKISAMNGKPFFNGNDLRIYRRDWSCFYVYRGGGRSRKRRIAVIGDIACNGNRARLRASAVQGSGRAVAGNFTRCGGVTVCQRTAVWAAGD